MNQEANIVFYEISSCGYYKFKSGDHHFGDINIFLKELINWSQNRDYVDTKIFTPKSGGNSLPVYLSDIHENSRDWIVTLWNEVPNSSGNILSLPRAAKVGSSSPSQTGVGPNNIPGFPTYFWFISSLNLMATINFDQPYAGRYAMDRYIREFILAHASYAKGTGNKNKRGKEIVAYNFPPNDDLLTLRAAFSTKPVLKQGEHEKIINSASQIVRINTKTELPATKQSTKDLWQKITESFKVKKFKMPTRKPTVSISTKFSISLTEESVKEIIKEWKDDGGLASDRDYGFELDGKLGNVLWLSDSIAKKTIELDLPVKNLSNLKAKHILSALETKKAEILQELSSKNTSNN